MAHKTASPQATVVNSKLKPRWMSKRVIIPVILMICILVAIFGVHKYYQDKSNARANAHELKLLQQDLTAANNGNNDNQQIVVFAQQLIAGAASGKYSISKATLGQYHLEEGTALLTLGQYKSAITQLETAPTLNSSLALPSLQWEVEAGYKAGERKQLIPLYNQLIQLENNSGDPMRGSVVAQYQENIQALENNQEINF